jgi:hypothetical protein
LSGLDPTVLRAAYTESGSWPVFRDNDAEEAAFDAALDAAVFADPTAASMLVADYVEPALSSTEDRPTNVDWLRRKPAFAGFLAEQPLDWLERYPFMPVASGNRCDITVSAALPGTQRLLVIEVKGQWNAELYTAASAQLAERYAIHPDAAGQGIFLVFWYGPDVPVAGRVTTGIASADALQDAIVAQVPEFLRAVIDVVVLDVSRAAATAVPAVRGRRRTNG